ncbi:hypothetical protein SLS62_000162 [Diatrype stigma]|uniref:Uncharacterized protein n=1 Tax=Diatrype stigma TaxID=117547 RepID=A0AAN9VAW3_9PEZI
MPAIQFFKTAFVAFKSPKAKEHHKRLVVGCFGTPPGTLSDQFATNYDRTFNFDSQDEREFDQISDDEVCSIEDSYDYDVDEKPLAPHCSVPIRTTHCAIERKLGKGLQNTLASTSSMTGPFTGAKRESGVGTKAGHVQKNALMPGKDNHAQKKTIFQPPPYDNETDDNESEDGSDDWTVIDMEVDGNPGEKSVSRCQKSESASGHGESRHPRIHPLCAAKYGHFFERQPRKRALTAC